MTLNSKIKFSWESSSAALVKQENNVSDPFFSQDVSHGLLAALHLDLNLFSFYSKTREEQDMQKPVLYCSYFFLLLYGYFDDFAVSYLEGGGHLSRSAIISKLICLHHF